MTRGLGCHTHPLAPCCADALQEVQDTLVALKAQAAGHEYSGHEVALLCENLTRAKIDSLSATTLPPEDPDVREYLVTLLSLSVHVPEEAIRVKLEKALLDLQAKGHPIPQAKYRSPSSFFPLGKV